VDTATVLNSWSLIDSTDNNAVVLSGQINRRGDEDYLVTDGIRVKVTGKYFPQLESAAYQNVGPNRRAIAGVDWPGVALLTTGAGYATLFPEFASTLVPGTSHTDSFTTVQFRFGVSQKAYRFLRLEDTLGVAPPAGHQYLYGGYRDVPFQCWDTRNNVQLEAAFVEHVVTDVFGTILHDTMQVATFDSTWAPDASGSGGNEYLISLSSAYSGVEQAAIGHNGAPMDSTLAMMWILWPRLRTPDDVIDTGDAYRFAYAIPANANDVYAFSTSSLVQNNTALAKGKLSSIRAVPNPYYAHSNYETDQFSRKLRFMNLPERCTIRLYNLAGQLVRTLQKDDPTTSILTWDLHTENQLPVGSGVYIFHVNAPEVGTHIGRVVVFTEKERLNSF